jgi:hypothetical protein
MREPAHPPTERSSRPTWNRCVGRVWVRASGECGNLAAHAVGGAWEFIEAPKRVYSAYGLTVETI